MEKSECRLSGGTKLILTLCLLQGNRGADELSTINMTSGLTPYVWDFIDERGWEESVYSALSYIKTQHVTSIPTFEQLDNVKLKKIIKSSLDKIRKPNQTISTANPKSQEPVAGKLEPEKLLGTELVERMASARARTAKKKNQTILASIPEPTDGKLF